MPNSLITPGLVLEVVQAGEDLVITQEEFSGILGTISEIIIGVFAFGFLGMLIGVITKRLTKETD